MKPLPSEPSPKTSTLAEALPISPSAFSTTSSARSSANRRNPSSAAPQTYPWLLVLSTAIAALFCLMYITKPIIQAPLPPLERSTPSALAARSATRPAPNTGTQTSLMPNADRLPGDLNPPAAGTKPALTDPNAKPGFEETNLRVQHILTAQTPGTKLARIDLDVPVLYQSRNLRWTPAEVAEARKLVARLMDYQEKSQILRTEGADLLNAWNQLVARSIPGIDLRADSPSLPANQENSSDAPRPASLRSTESIQIQSSGK
jgi:hypothetical protein